MAKDIIIVGNGIIGSTVALSLLENGYNVCLVAPYIDSGQSATLAAGAMFGVLGEVTHSELKPLHRVDFEARLQSVRLYDDLFERLLQRTGTKTQSRKGTFIVATNVGHEDVPNINAMKHLADEYGLAAEWVEPEEIAWYHPNSGQIARKALFLGDEGFVPSGYLLSAVHKALTTYESPAFKVIPRHCRSLIVEKDIVRGIVLNNGEKVTGDRVVLCAGYRTRHILASSPLPKDLFPQILGGKGTSFIIDATAQSASLDYVFRTPNRDFACGTHVVPLGDGRIYVGATNRLTDTQQDEVHATMGELHTLTHSAVHEINTYIRTCDVRAVQCGIRPFTSDGRPLVGKSDMEGLFMATGTYRNGILFAPLIANIVLKELESDDAVPENPYSAQRLNRQYPKNRNEIIENGVKHLVSFIQEPHGRLPYHREKELERVMNLLVKASFLKDRDAIKTIDDLSDAIDGYDIQEIILDVFLKMQN